MSWEVSVRCDGGQPCGNEAVYGDSVAEVRKEARAAGWKLNVDGEDFCADCSRPAAVRERELWEQQERAWRATQERHHLVQEKQCPNCLAAPGDSCRTSTGNRSSEEHASRRALVL